MGLLLPISSLTGQSMVAEASHHHVALLSAPNVRRHFKHLHEVLRFLLFLRGCATFASRWCDDIGHSGNAGA